MYHQYFGDGADTENIHGDSHLHGRACNRKYPYTVVFIFCNENQIKFVPPGPARRMPRSIRARTSGGGGRGTQHQLVRYTIWTSDSELMLSTYIVTPTSTGGPASEQPS